MDVQLVLERLMATMPGLCTISINISLCSCGVVLVQHDKMFDEIYPRYYSQDQR